MTSLFIRNRMLFILVSLVILGGCSAAHYRKSADKEVYRIIGAKSSELKGMPSVFTIDTDTRYSQQDRSTSLVLTLADALEIGVTTSREYQSQKESLYSQALSLTFSRHEFDPIFSGSASGEIAREGKESTVSSVLTAGITKMLSTGGDFSLSIVTNLFRYISFHDPVKSATSTINASFIQPLLRGGGRKVAIEHLTQSERNMIYAIRNFVRFRKSFSVSIAKRFSSILQQKNQVENSWTNYQSLKEDRVRAEEMAKRNRLPRLEVDQTKQRELSARDQWIRTRERYKTSLDEFKIELGLPTDLLLELSLGAMETITDKGIVRLDIPLDEAISIALANRLDLKNTSEKVEDAQRKIDVARNALKPGLDLVFDYSNTSEARKPARFNDETDSYSAGADLDLPFDRMSERNSYRQALINCAVAKRNLSEDIDRIKLEVRNAFRSLEQAEQSYEIQKNALTLAQERVESTSILQQAGRATTRDVLESREDLLDARNNVTAALVEHFNARLDLFLAMEKLTIDDKGLWVEEQ